ncbi:MAG: ABC transporter substrate-binding protein, partial [Acetobacteraceae bacterium]
MSKHSISRRQALAMTGGIAGGITLGAGLPAARAYAAAKSGGPELKIGAVLELSGPDASGGHLCRRGYEFGVAAINKAGGVEIGGKKYPIRMIVQDARSDPATGANATSRLITEEKVDAMFGAYSSPVQLAMNPICAKYQVTCIAGSAESPENWSPHPEYTFGIIPSVDLTAGKALGFLVAAAHPRPTTCAVIGANEAFSKDAKAGFAKGAKDAGLKLTTNT